MRIFELELYAKINKTKQRELMNIKKLVTGIFFLVFLSSCAQNAALLGPAYTLASTGNVYQAGLSFGTEQTITHITGKTTGEKIQEMLTPKKKDDEFKKLVKRRIEETRKKLNFTN